MITTASHSHLSSFARKTGLLLASAWLLGLTVALAALSHAANQSEEREIAFVDGVVQGSATLCVAVRPGAETGVVVPVRDELAQSAGRWFQTPKYTRSFAS